MHIPDGFLSAGVTGVTWAAAGISVTAALRAERSDPNPIPAGVLGAVAAFVFAAQLINVPIAPGTSGHLVGAVLAAMLVGPYRAMIVMAVVLAVQALLFQDGGVAALGANIMDMGVTGVLAGYAVATIAARWLRSPRGQVVGGVLGAFASTLAAAVLAAVWLGLSGLYPVLPIVQFMTVTHVAIGVLEAALTGAILVTVMRWRPDLVRGVGASGPLLNAGAVVAGVFAVALGIAAFVSPWVSALPDGLERAARQLGFAARARAAWRAPFPDYAIPVVASPAVTTALAGVIGTIAVAIIAWAVSRGLKSTQHAAHR